MPSLSMLFFFLYVLPALLCLLTLVNTEYFDPWEIDTGFIFMVFIPVYNILISLIGVVMLTCYIAYWIYSAYLAIRYFITKER